MADRAMDKQSKVCMAGADILWQGTLSHLDQMPLTSDVERLSDPDFEINKGVLVNLAAKYFFAFVHPGAQDNPVPVGEIERLLKLFGRCKSLNEPEDDIEIMNRLRCFAPSLGFSADMGRAALVLRELLGQSPAPGVRYLGLDLHTGSGLLVLGQYLLARRVERGNIEIWGIEPDPVVAKRAGELLRALGAGNVIEASPEDKSAYEMIGGRPVSMISTPMVIGESVKLSDNKFFGSFATLFAMLGSKVEDTAFFPDGLIAYSRDMNISLIFSKENGFQRPPEYADIEFHPQGLFIDGRIVPLHRLASEVRNLR